MTLPPIGTDSELTGWNYANIFCSYMFSRLFVRPPGSEIDPERFATLIPGPSPTFDGGNQREEGIPTYHLPGLIERSSVTLKLTATCHFFCVCPSALGQRWEGPYFYWLELLASELNPD